MDRQELDSWLTNRGCCGEVGPEEDETPKEISALGWVAQVVGVPPEEIVQDCSE